MISNEALCCAADLKYLYLITLILKRIYMVFLLATLLSPMGMIACITSVDDDTVCELLEDFSKEEEGDDTEEESNIEESQVFRQDLFQIELIFTANQNARSCFGEHNHLHTFTPEEISTPPPELK